MSTVARARPTLHHPTQAAPHEALVETVDIFRLDAARSLDPDRQSEMGQFMTPAPVARLMVSMFGAQGRSLRLLDAGAGVGSLTAAWVAEICARKKRPDEISVTTYEVDPGLAARLHSTLEACRLHCEAAGVRFHSELLQEDFIEAGVSMLHGGLFVAAPEPFDCAVLNPPYRKVNSDSRTRGLLGLIGIESTNLYTDFIELAAGLLRPEGELVAITPRSFCNGPYFRPFRTRFLETMALKRIHSFETRDRAFSEDRVLQENVIVHAVRASARQGPLIVSSSLGPEDDCPTWRELDFSEIVKPQDPDRFIHIPQDALSQAVSARMAQFHTTLHELGLEVSTGRVVDFRAADFLRAEPGHDTVPLIYPGHMAKGFIEWPKTGGKKPNALAVAPATEELIVPRGFYVLVRRFSSKEERRRIVAAVYNPARLPASDVAFENHLNYFHAHGRPLGPELAKGLAAFLNSSLVDTHFREWSGHTQVNASDLRRLRYPTGAQLESVGARITETFPDQDELDRRLEEELLDMPRLKKTPDPIRAKKRLQKVQAILKELGLPRQQQNERSALTLLALLDLKPKTPWSKAGRPLRGITEMMRFFADHYGKVYAPNTRETVRRQTVHQFMQAGLAVLNPDEPKRPTNDPDTVYQIEASAHRLLKRYETEGWNSALRAYLTSAGTLARRYASEREMKRIPLALPSGKTITLSPGGQNVLVKEIVEQFCPRFTPRAKRPRAGSFSSKPSPAMDPSAPSDTTR